MASRRPRRSGSVKAESAPGDGGGAAGDAGSGSDEGGDSLAGSGGDSDVGGGRGISVADLHAALTATAPEFPAYVGLHAHITYAYGRI